MGPDPGPELKARLQVVSTVGGIPHDEILRSIELLGREVAPAVRDEVAAGPKRYTIAWRWASSASIASRSSSDRHRSIDSSG